MRISNKEYRIAQILVCAFLGIILIVATFLRLIGWILGTLFLIASGFLIWQDYGDKIGRALRR